MNTLLSIEELVLRATFDDNEPVSLELRAQIGECAVVSRMYSETGWVVVLRVPAELRTSSCVGGIVRCGNVVVDVEELEHELGSLVSIDQGLLSALELYTFGEALPKRLEPKVVRHATGIPTASKILSAR